MAGGGWGGGLEVGKNCFNGGRGSKFFSINGLVGKNGGGGGILGFAICLFFDTAICLVII